MTRDLPFRFFEGEDHVWRLSGYVDVSGTKEFADAFSAVTRAHFSVVDASELRFIDVGAMRVIAAASTSSKGKIVVRGAPEVFRRCWELGGFDEIAPSVELAR